MGYNIGTIYLWDKMTTYINIFLVRVSYYNSNDLAEGRL